MMRAIRKASPEVTYLEGRALLSALGAATTARPAAIVELKTLALDGTLRGHIVDHGHNIAVTGHGHFQSTGRVNFVATFDETVGLDTISLTDGVVKLRNRKVDLTLSISPTTAVVPRNQFHAHFTTTSGSSGSGSFDITKFSGTSFVAKLHSGG
jgi:hypothetical protein